MQFNWRGLTDRIADLAALGFQRRRDVRRPRRSRTLRLRTEALECRNMLASYPLLAAGSGGHLTSLWRHTAAPVAHHSAPSHVASTTGSLTLSGCGTIRLSAPNFGSGGQSSAGAVSIQGGTTISGASLAPISGNNSNTFAGSTLVQSSSLGTGTMMLSSGTLRLSNTVVNTGTISVAGTSFANLTYPGTISLTAGTLSGGTLAKSGGGVLELAAAPSLGNNSSLTISGGMLRFNTVIGTPTIGTGVTANISSTGTLELAGTVSTLSPNIDRVHIVNLSSQLSTTGNGDAGWLDGTGSTIVNSGADLTANHIIQNALVIGSTPFSAGIVTLSASDASGNPLSSQLLAAQSIAPSADATTLTPLGTSASPPAIPYYWNQPG